jgi:hypothetical protein
MRPLTQTSEREHERGIPIGQAIPERVCVTTQSLSLADVARVQSHGIIYLFVSNRIAMPVIKTASTSSSSPGVALVR